MQDYSNNCRYLIRVATYILFLSAFVPTLSDYMTYLEKITCHTYGRWKYKIYIYIKIYVCVFSLYSDLPIHSRDRVHNDFLTGHLPPDWALRSAQDQTIYNRKEVIIRLLITMTYIVDQFGTWWSFIFCSCNFLYIRN